MFFFPEDSFPGPELAASRKRKEPTKGGLRVVCPQGEALANKSRGEQLHFNPVQESVQHGNSAHHPRCQESPFARPSGNLRDRCGRPG